MAEQLVGRPAGRLLMRLELENEWRDRRTISLWLDCSEPKEMVRADVRVRAVALASFLANVCANFSIPKAMLSTAKPTILCSAKLQRRHHR